MSIIRITKKFRAILSRHQKLRVIELAIIMVFGGLLEMLSVSLIIPFMNMVIDPSEIMGRWYVQAICEAFHLQSERSFLIFAAIVLACVYILKNVYLILQYSIQYRFVYGNMFEMQRRLLDSYIHRPYEFFLKINSGEVMRIVSSDTSNTFALLSTLLILFSASPAKLNATFRKHLGIAALMARRVRCQSLMIPGFCGAEARLGDSKRETGTDFARLNATFLGNGKKLHLVLQTDF